MANCARPVLEADLGLRCVVVLDEPELRRRPHRTLCRALLESSHSEPTADASTGNRVQYGHTL